MKLFILLFLFLIVGHNLFADKKVELRLFKDYETEAYVKEIISLFHKDPIDVIIYQSNEINAFVIEGRKIFISDSLIKESASYPVLAAILAHELGHIEAGHVLTTKNEIYKTQIASGLLDAAMFINEVNMMEGGYNDIDSMLAITTLLVSSDLLLNDYLFHSREKEEVADLKAAVALKRAKIPVSGLYEALTLLYNK